MNKLLSFILGITLLWGSEVFAVDFLRPQAGELNNLSINVSNQGFLFSTTTDEQALFTVPTRIRTSFFEATSTADTSIMRGNLQVDGAFNGAGANLTGGIQFNAQGVLGQIQFIDAVTLYEDTPAGEVENYLYVIDGGLLVLPSVTANPIFKVSTVSGLVGIGTSSPYSKLSVAGQIVGQNFISTSTTIESNFTRLTITNSTTTNATTTNFTITGLLNCNNTSKLATNAGGALFCDTDLTGSGSAYPFTPTDVFGSFISGTSTSLFTTGGFYASSSSRLSSTTIQGDLNVGRIVATGTSASLFNSITVSGTCTGCGGGGVAYSFTPTNHFGNIISATTTSLFASGLAGFYASSTSYLSTTTISGTLNLGTLTATSGTSYLNALTLGTALADANIASAATWNAKESALTFNSPLSRSVNAISFLFNTANTWTGTNIFNNATNTITNLVAVNSTTTNAIITNATTSTRWLTNITNCNTTQALTVTGNVEGCGTISAAASPGGLATEIQFNNGAGGIGGAGKFVFISSTGNVGLGTTTPWGALSIATTTNPAFVVATSSGMTPLLFVTGTTSSLTSNGARVLIGTSTQTKAGLLDTLFVAGTINTSLASYEEHFIRHFINVVADGVIPTNGLFFDIGAASSCTGSKVSTTTGALRLATGATKGMTCHLDFANMGQFVASSTPTFETRVKLDTVTASTTAVLIGFANIATGGLVATATPSGAYFYYDNATSSYPGKVPQPWHAITKGSATSSARTTTSINPISGVYQTLRIELAQHEVNFYINGEKVARHLTSIPQQPLDLEFFLISWTAAAKAMDIDYIKVWEKLATDAGKIF